MQQAKNIECKETKIGIIQLSNQYESIIEAGVASRNRLQTADIVKPCLKSSQAIGVTKYRASMESNQFARNFAASDIEKTTI
jgi:hypothetical protein